MNYLPKLKHYLDQIGGKYPKNFLNISERSELFQWSTFEVCKHSPFFTNTGLKWQLRRSIIHRITTPILFPNACTLYEAQKYY